MVVAKFDQIVLDASPESKKKFWDKVEKKGHGGCWLFMGTSYAQKTSFFCTESISITGHRASLLWKTQQSFPELVARHSCLQKQCVNPSHLDWGTHKQNHADKKRDGTWTFAETHPCSTLTNSKVLSIWEDLRARKITMTAIAEKHGTRLHNVVAIRDRRNWTSLTDTFVPLPKIKRAEDFSFPKRKPREALTIQQINIICEMIDEGDSLRNIAKHTNLSTKTVNRTYFRKYGRFPCYIMGTKRTKEVKDVPLPPAYWRRKCQAAGEISPSS